jgi:hypothetical protein
MQRLLAGSAALLLAGGAFLAVLFYNTWSWCGGRCTADTFLTFGPFGMLLLSLNLLAVFLLVGLKLHRRLTLSRSHCRCGTPLTTEWLYCPGCGRSANSLSANSLSANSLSAE